MSFGVAQRTSAGNTVFPIESCLYEKRIVWVEGDIDAEAANNFIKQIVWLNQQNKSEAIKVMISTSVAPNQSNSDFEKRFAMFDGKLYLVLQKCRIPDGNLSIG